MLVFRRKEFGDVESDRGGEDEVLGSEGVMGDEEAE